MNTRPRVALAWLVLLVSMVAAHAGPKAEVPAVVIQAKPLRSVEGSVSGRVLTPEGTPVKGAPVFWTDRIGIETRVLASVKSDDAGAYRFDNATQLRKKGEYSQLVALVDGWGLTYRRVPPDQNALDIRLEPATRLRIAFLDPEGKPTADLPVSASLLVAEEAGFCTIPMELVERFEARTDGKGIATIDNLPRGYRLLPAVRDAQFAQLDSKDWIPLTASPETQAKAIRLKPGASLRGCVTFGPSRKPVAGIRVGAQGIDGLGGWGETVTGADGSYHLPQLGPGAYNVALDLTGELANCWTARAHERLLLRPGEHLNGIDFRLIRGAVLTGRVLAADNGAPIVGLGVTVYSPAHPRSGAWSQGALTGPDGRYTLRVPGGKQHLFLHPSATPPGFFLPPRKEHDLTVREGETVFVDFRLPRARLAKPVRGRVLAPDGTPVAGAEVVVRSSDSLRAAAATRLTDAGGAFTLEAELVAQPVTLRARHESMATIEGTAATAGDEVTLRLRRDGLVTLSGHVTDTSGGPIAGAEVTLLEGTYENSQSVAKTVTDRQGGYAFPSLWADARYSVHATAEGYGQSHSGENDGLRPGETRPLEPLVLRKADRSVAGRVVDASGDPVAGATVRISGSETNDGSQATDGEGRFRFDGVVDETIELQVGATPERPASKKVPAGSMEVLLVLPQEGGRSTPDDGLTERFASLHGRKAPPLATIAWVNSAPRTLEQLQGKVVLIDFWGMGCGPCVGALPGVQRTAEQFAKRGVIVIGLHYAGGNPTELGEFAKKHRLTYPLAIDASGGHTFRNYGIHGIPSTAVIDRDGNLAYLGMSLSEALSVIGSLCQPSVERR
jgi:protocatechuate 3,4-dioxygenase beta subunit/thiol-disulfide isomerase/thioredoxin